MITKQTRIFALLLVFLFIPLLLLPLSVCAEADEHEEGMLSDVRRPYSLVCEEGEKEASLYMNSVYAERGDVDLCDAFARVAEKGASLFISVGSVKLYLTAKLVSDVAERGEPVLLYIEKISPEDEKATDGEGNTSADEVPRDVVYRFDLGFPFSYRSLRIAVKHPTKNADGMHLIASDESGAEAVLKSAYGDSLASFFPEETAFTLRITEEPLPEKDSLIPSFLICLLLLLATGSIVLTILIARGTLKRFYFNRTPK